MPPIKLASPIQGDTFPTKEKWLDHAKRCPYSPCLASCPSRAPGARFEVAPLGGRLLSPPCPIRSKRARNAEMRGSHMSRLFGNMRQVGIVVRDIEAAMRHWVEVCGVGHSEP